MSPSAAPDPAGLTRQPAPATPAPEPARWYAQEALVGSKVRLVPLTVEHAEGFIAALWAEDGAPEVYRWLGSAPPATVEQARDEIRAALAHRAAGLRLPYAQLDAGTGQFIGTTSYYEVAPAARALAIGHTWLGTPWWRTGHNTESKLLLLEHAFTTLGAARVVW
ncbi:MAG TPA: GNAT family N-acetyltransferase, partial [Jatrophihabitans sp.]|nr:GNAT family N-acetyltransferase [Jatrophihabitans sp.]